MENRASTKLNQWLAVLFANREINQIYMLIIGSGLFLWIFIDDIAVILVMVLISYICANFVDFFIVRFKFNRIFAVSVVTLGVIFSCILGSYTLTKLLSQLQEIKTRLPKSNEAVNNIVVYINEYLPSTAKISQETVITYISDIVGVFSSFALNNTVSLVGNIFSFAIFLVIMPMFVFFVLKDKVIIIDYISKLLPYNEKLKYFFVNVNTELVSYLHGKIFEAFVISIVTWWIMLIFDVELGLTLSIIIGLSVFIPFVGIIVVTVLLAIFVFLQFGFGSEFAWILGLHLLIQILDGQILVPLLFSETINIHPSVIFAFILFFGGIWGAWGIFLAIPLASFFKCLINTLKSYYRVDNPVDKLI